MASAVKTVNRTGTIAWCPVNGGELLACGTVAGTLNLSFDTTATLEVFALQPSSGTPHLTPVGHSSAPDRFFQLAWGAAPSLPCGLLAGALANGLVNVWDANAMMQGDDDSLLLSMDKHSSAVQALDFNPFQHNLLASGGADNQLLVWDLTQTEQPKVYAPGGRTSQNNNVLTAVQWNRQVPHIMAANQQTGNTEVWDLRNKRQVVSFYDTQQQRKARAIAWSPVTATSIVTACVEDHQPHLLVWDLRNYQVPSQVLQGHSSGVWSLSWSERDPNLLLSSARDNTTLCWDLKEGRVCREVARTSTWTWDVQWNPVKSGVAASASLDGVVAVHSLVDPSAPSSSLREQPQALPEPPQWLRRPSGVSFGFGGRLVHFGADASHRVHITPVVTDAGFVERSAAFREALAGPATRSQWVQRHVEQATSDEERELWTYLRAHCAGDAEAARLNVLQLLGFDEATAVQEVASFMQQHQQQQQQQVDGDATDDVVQEDDDVDVDDVVHDDDEVDDDESSKAQSDADEDVEGAFVAQEEEGEGEEDAFGVVDDPFAHIGADAPLGAVESPPQDEAPLAPQPEPQGAQGVPQEEPLCVWSAQDALQSAVGKALISGLFRQAVDCCAAQGKWAEALVLANDLGGPEVWAYAKQLWTRHQSGTEDGVAPFVVLAQRMTKPAMAYDIALQCDVRQWKAALALILTYTRGQELVRCASALGKRLESLHMLQSASLCFIAASDVEGCARVWTSSESLHDIVEKISIFNQSLPSAVMTSAIASKFTQYAEILSSQGDMEGALYFLDVLQETDYMDTTLSLLYDRISRATRPSTVTSAASPSPSPVTTSPASPVAHVSAPGAPVGVSGAPGAPVGAHSAHVNAPSAVMTSPFGISPIPTSPFGHNTTSGVTIFDPSAASRASPSSPSAASATTATPSTAAASAPVQTVSAANAHCVAALQAQLTALSAHYSSVPSSAQRVAQLEKRFYVVLQRVEKGELEDDCVSSLSSFANALNTNDLQTAQQHCQVIVTQFSRSLTASGVVAVKRLMQARLKGI